MRSRLQLTASHSDIASSASDCSTRAQGRRMAAAERMLQQAMHALQLQLASWACQLSAGSAPAGASDFRAVAKRRAWPPSRDCAARASVPPPAFPATPASRGAAPPPGRPAGARAISASTTLRTRRAAGHQLPEFLLRESEQHRVLVGRDEEGRIAFAGQKRRFAKALAGARNSSQCPAFRPAPAARRGFRLQAPANRSSHGCHGLDQHRSRPWP